MKAYEAGTAAYFATPPVNLIYAFHASLSLITGKTSDTPGKRIQLHNYTNNKLTLEKKKNLAHRSKSASNSIVKPARL
jgi:alanine-glyoxylate transaminase/serine-glyoxylate transaminase/serine-pyruvate transaminase